MTVDPNKTYVATIETSEGDLTADLYVKDAPKTVNNFVFLAREHFYDGLTFHRVIPGFVVQGGDPQGNGSGGPGYKFADELPKAGAYKVGSLAMANSGPNTNGSQFFICTDDLTGRLPKNYTLFGVVTKGLDIVDRIVSAPRDGRDLPHEPVAMTSVTIEEE